MTSLRPSPRPSKDILGQDVDCKASIAELEKTSSSAPKPAYDNKAADIGTHSEISLTVSRAFRTYWRAVLWSVAISMATVMESYGLQLVNSFYAFPQFKQKYGEKIGENEYSVPAKWQMALNLSTMAGLLIGVFANGYIAERFGPRKTMMVNFVALTPLIFICFFAPNVEALFAGQLLCAIPWGFFSAATPAYAAEICPLILRGYLTTYVNLCWVMGHLIATGVLTGCLKINSEWSYRIPFAIQWIWPIPLLLAVYLAPESPWWLVRRGRSSDALLSIRRIITVPDSELDPRNTVAMIERTVALEREMHAGGSYADCFRGTNRRRTEIAMVSWGCQILPGFAIQNFTTYFFTLAGLASSDSFKLSLGLFSMAFVGTVLSWFVQTRFGRRTIYMAGLVGMVPIMWTVGFLDLAPNRSGSVIEWAQSGLLLFWFFVYGITIGPIPYAIAAEVGASNLRIPTVALGRSMYYFLSVLNVICAPYMLNPTEGNLKGKAAFPAAVFTVLLIAWTFFRLPETKGLTPETLDHLFHENAPARRFAEEAKKYQ